MEQKTLGGRIREERLKLNLTQEKLAEDVNLSMAYIGQVERGERSLTLDNLVAVANRLGGLPAFGFHHREGRYGISAIKAVVEWQVERGEGAGSQYGEAHDRLSG